ncbi:MAG: methyltransferase domain-containing protein [Candidatus Acidiferrales bacterium]
MSLICPICHSPLTAEPSSLACPGCGRVFPLRDAVPDFWPEGGDFYWGEFSPDVARQAAERMRADGLDAAVALMATHNPDITDYLTSVKRIDWLFHCLDSLEPHACLDVGSGWGSLSVPLTRFFREVWSLEGAWPRLDFQRAYAERQAAGNLRFVRGRLSPLPFPNQSFDLVVANGVLEWVGLIDPRKPVPVLQTEFLREVRRVLKPNGLLYLGIENRFAFGNFAGARDHSGLPFTSLLPRPLASFVVRRFRKPERYEDFRTTAPWPDYRTWTYCLRGYRQLLAGAGFPAASFAWAWPGYNLPWLSGDLEDNRSLSVFLDFMRTRAMVYLPKKTVRQRIIRWGAAFPYRSLVAAALRALVPSFLIFSRAGDGPPLRLPALQLSGVRKIVTIAPGNGGRLEVRKRPRFPEDAAELEKEQALLQRFNPEWPATRLAEGDGPRYVEPYLAGGAPDATSLRHQQLALRWLLEFQRQTTAGQWASDELAAPARQELHEARPALRRLGIESEVGAGIEDFLRRLHQRPLARVAEHGDFWKANMILQPGDRLFVLDWQHFREDGEPFFDFSFFLFTLYCYGKRFSPGAAFDRGLEQNTAELLAEFNAAHEFAPGDLAAYLPRFTVRYLLRRTPSPELLVPFAEQVRSWSQRVRAR